MAEQGTPGNGDRRDERPLRSRTVRVIALALVTACVGAGAFGGVVFAKPQPHPDSCPPGHQYGGPPGHEYGGPPGRQYGGPPGHQYGGPPGHQQGGC